MQDSKYDNLELCAADKGGYFVSAGRAPREAGIFNPILYAGSLTECLGFIEANIRRVDGQIDGPAPAVAA